MPRVWLAELNRANWNRGIVVTDSDDLWTVWKKKPGRPTDWDRVSQFKWKPGYNEEEAQAWAETEVAILILRGG